MVGLVVENRVPVPLAKWKCWLLKVEDWFVCRTGRGGERGRERERKGGWALGVLGLVGIGRGVLEDWNIRNGLARGLAYVATSYYHHHHFLFSRLLSYVAGRVSLLEVRYSPKAGVWWERIDGDVGGEVLFFAGWSRWWTILLGSQWMDGGRGRAFRRSRHDTDGRRKGGRWAS